MNRRVAWLVAGLCIAGAARGAGAQDARLVSALGVPAARAVQAYVDSARALGLPGGGLTGVALEGVSRHVSGPRVVAAVASYFGALRTAQGALGSGASDGELSAGAGAVLSGMTPAQLARFKSARTHRSVTVPLVVVADLIARGVPRDTAMRSVYLAVTSGAGDADLSILRERVESDIRAGAPAGAAILSRLTGVPGVAPLVNGHLPSIVPPLSPDRR